MSITTRFRSTLPLVQRISAFGNPSLEGLRDFSTQAKPTDVDVKVPISMFGGSGSYASALFMAASKANVLDRVELEVGNIVEASKKSPFFSQFIRDLSVPRETRVKAISEIVSEAGLSDVTKNFLAVLADNGRLKYIEAIGKRFDELTMANKGEVKVTVTSVIPLPAEEEKELQHTLKDILPNAKSVKVEQKINTSILGGLIIEFGEKVFDMSIKTRAKQMEKFLREPLIFDQL